MSAESTQQEAPPPARQEPPPAPPRGRQEGGQDAPPAKKSGGKGKFFFIVLAIAVLLGILVVVKVLPTRHRAGEREETQSAIARGAITVQAVKPTRSPAQFDFSLPGSAEPLTTATLYARVNGYLKRRLVDIGDTVAEGQLLVEIDAPDTDAQFSQAQAQLDQARAAEGIARVTFERQKRLRDQKVISDQEYDQAQANYNQAVANAKAAESNLQNLSVQKGFEKITAPFAGVITARFLDDGALITTGGGAATPSIFTLQAVETLRVFIYVPQTYVANIKPGQDVQISATEYPQQVFRGTVTRTSRALDPVTRTERVEIQLPSEGGKLRPGMYLSVRFVVAQNNPAMIVPAGAVEIRKEGPRVLVIGPDQKVGFKNVKLGRDFGKTIEITAGLDGGEMLVGNPSSDLAPGQKVEIAKPDKKEGGGGGKGGDKPNEGGQRQTGGGQGGAQETGGGKSGG